jgi:hypothetical protein
MARQRLVERWAGAHWPGHDTCHDEAEQALQVRDDASPQDDASSANRLPDPE